MPDYEVTSPTGAKFRVTAPEGATQDEVLAYAQKNFQAQAPQQAPAEKPYAGPGTFHEAPNQFLRGQTLGLSDYPGAAALYATDRLQHLVNPKVPTPSYEQDLQAIRGENADYKSANPIAGYGAEIAGGITSPIFKGIGQGVDAGLSKAAQVLGRAIPRYLGYGIQGAVGGGAAGAGNAENAQGGVPSLADIGSSAKTGAEIGGALGVAVPAVVEGAQWTGDKLRTAAQGALDRIPGAQESAAGRRMFRAAERDNLSADDIRRMVDDMGPNATIADVGGNVRGLAENAAQQPGASLKAAEQLGQRQYGQAEDIRAAAEKAAGGTKDQLITNRALKAAPLYEQAFQPQGGPVTARSFQINDPTIEDILSQPESHKGLSEGMDAIRRDNVIARASNPNVKPLDPMDFALKRNPDSGQWEKVGTPNLRMIDAVKRGYDIMLESDTPDMVHPRTGTPTNKARQIAAFRDVLIGRTESQLPVDPRFGTSTWAAARDQWKTLSKPIEAMNTIDNVLDKARDASDVTGRLYGSPAAREKLSGLTQDPQAMTEFGKTLENWKTFAQTNRQVTGNSRTSYRNAANEDASSDIPGIAVNVAQGNFGSGLAGLVRSLGKLMTRPSPGVADQLTPMFTSDRASQDAFLQLMRDRATASAMMGQRLGPLIRSAPGPIAGSLMTGGSNQEP